MKTVAVVGANGKMGKLVCEKFEKDCRVVKVDINNKLSDFDGLDLVVDFASHQSSAESARYCAEHGVRLVIGSTGQTEEEMEAIVNASKKVPVLKAGNFSLGIVLLKKALLEVLKVGVEDITIFEKHHRNKVDSPSGTALEIARFIEKNSNKTPQILAERGGKEIGTHSVDVYFGDEVISIKHQAFSRMVFADGAKLAGDFLLNKNEARLYSFEDAIDD